MGVSVSDQVMRALRQWGIDRVYAHPGRAVKALAEAAARCEGMDVVTAAGAELAGLSAFAYAKFTGRPGVCVTAWGRETARALEALQDASLEGRPVLVLAGAGSPPRWNRQRQEDFRSMCSGVAAAGVVKVSEPSAAAATVWEAVHAAVRKGSVACVVVPRTLQESEGGAAEAPEAKSVEASRGRVLRATAPAGAPALLQRVRETAGAQALVACEWEEPCAQRTAEVITPAEATLYPGVPYVVAAKFAHPDRPVVAVAVGGAVVGSAGGAGVAAGGRAMQLLGGNGLVAVRRYWSEWRDPRLVVLVLDEAVRGGFDAGAAGATGAMASNFSLAAYASILGLGGERVENEDGVAAAVARGLKAGRPVVVEALLPRVEETPAVLAEVKVSEMTGVGAVAGSRRVVAGAFTRAGAG